MKVVTVIKYALIIADLVGMAGLCYAGVYPFINWTTTECSGTTTGATSESSGQTNWNCSTTSTRSVQDIVWGIYYM